MTDLDNIRCENKNGFVVFLKNQSTFVLGIKHSHLPPLTDSNVSN